MTAEERMRSLLADVLDAMHESALRDEGRNAIHRCDIEAAMKMLALEGEQGNPTKDQRGAAATAACLSEEAVAGSEKGKSPLTEFPEQDAAAPHHHLAGKFEWVEIGFSAQLDAELAPHHHSRPEQQAEASGHLANARDAQVSAPAREPSAEVTARNVADGAESADLLTPSRVRAMAIAFDRLRAEMAQELHIVFDGPPAHQSGRFVEVETADGKSISAGRWEQRGDYWHLILGKRK